MSRIEFSQDQIIFMLMLIIILTFFIPVVYDLGFKLGLSIPDVVDRSEKTFSIGSFLRIFFQYYGLFSILLIMFINNYMKIKAPNPHFRHFSYALLIFLSVLSIFGMIVYGITSSLSIPGYTNKFLNLLIYFLTALFLGYYFRNEALLVSILIMMIGIFTVTELWELPFNIMYIFDRGLHPILYFIASLPRFMPTYLFFYLFRKKFLVFISKYFYLFLFSLLSIIYLTVGILFHTFRGTTFTYAQSLLRLAYASFLVFLPLYLTRRIKE